MTTLHSIERLKRLHASTAGQAKRLEDFATALQDFATRSPSYTIADLYGTHGHTPGWFTFGDGSAEHMAVRVRKEIELLVPDVMRRVARSLTAEAQAALSESESVAAELAAILGPDWNEQPKAHGAPQEG